MPEETREVRERRGKKTGSSAGRGCGEGSKLIGSTRAGHGARRNTREQEGDEQEIINNEKGNAEDCRIERPGQKTALPMNM